MANAWEYHKLDLFITFTCNHLCPKITHSVLPKQQPLIVNEICYLGNMINVFRKICSFYAEGFVACTTELVDWLWTWKWTMMTNYDEFHASCSSKYMKWSRCAGTIGIQHTEGCPFLYDKHKYRFVAIRYVLDVHVPLVYRISSYQSVSLAASVVKRPLCISMGFRLIAIKRETVSTSSPLAYQRHMSIALQNICCEYLH